MENEAFDKEIKKIRKRKIKIAFISILLAIIIIVPVFLYIRLTTEARLALREAKNAKLALKMLDIEYYSENEAVYDPNSINGIISGAEDAVYRITGENEGRMQILQYNAKTREITGFIYETGYYEVIYTGDADGNGSWKVNYLINVLDYKEK